MKHIDKSLFSSIIQRYLSGESAEHTANSLNFNPTSKQNTQW